MFDTIVAIEDTIPVACLVLIAMEDLVIVAEEDTND